MPTPSIHPVLHSFGYSIDYLRELVADVPIGRFAEQPSGMKNHPAWVIGHLTFACQLLGGAIHLQPWLAADWGARYGPGSEPEAKLSLYEPKEKALAILFDAHARFMKALEPLTDADLDREFPVSRYRVIFPTIRHALTQVLVGHTAYHIGQISMWRKAMGMPSLARSFE